MTDLEIGLLLLLSFLAGRLIPRSIYIGTDKEKYEKAEAGILLRRNTND